MWVGIGFWSLRGGGGDCDVTDYSACYRLGYEQIQQNIGFRVVLYIK